jgi:hypothetical protein
MVAVSHEQSWLASYSLPYGVDDCFQTIHLPQGMPAFGPKTAVQSADHVEPWRYSAELGETIIEGGPFKLLNYKVPYYLERPYEPGGREFESLRARQLFGARVHKPSHT